MSDEPEDGVMKSGVPGIVLVHGYLGAPADMAPLASRFSERFGGDTVESVCLPGHLPGGIPTFDESSFLSVLGEAIDRQLARCRPLVLVGHSTGGNLLLAELARRLSHAPGSLGRLLLLVLCASPPRINASYPARWAAHTAGRTLSIDDVGGFVSLVNRLARRAPLAIPAPVLVVHGEDDELVPVDDCVLWRNGRFAAPFSPSFPLRQVRVPGAGHQLFQGSAVGQAVDAIAQAVDDALRYRAAPLPPALVAAEPGLSAFCGRWPDSTGHVVNSPAARRLAGASFPAEEIARCAPTLANIEITTRCTLGCIACARTRLKRSSRFMSRADFCRVLERLPHAYRIVLVGLGEPLLHPEVIDFIGLAAAEGRRVGLVTNAMGIDDGMAQRLCTSGLSSITFSIDAVSQACADRVRPGSDMGRISANIRRVDEARHKLQSSLATSVFTALGVDTVPEFSDIVDFAADHGVDALMVTDLNFLANQSRSLNVASRADHQGILRRALRRAVERRLPVLSVHGLEEFSLETRYLDYLLLRGNRLVARSPGRANCLSPWQSIPVGVDGRLTVCDCQPEAVIGNLHESPVAEWWNGSRMREQRRRMESADPPEVCRSCPRF